MDYELKDSGERSNFTTGAVRDLSVGKGRCDLLPFSEVAHIFSICGKASEEAFFEHLSAFMKDGDIEVLYKCLLVLFFDRHVSIKKSGCCKTTIVSPCATIPEDIILHDLSDYVLALSFHLEKGAIKYEERNWEKGIPLSKYIDSASRHYLKHLRGDNDENHFIACFWNLVCAIWTYNTYFKPNCFDPILFDTLFFKGLTNSFSRTTTGTTSEEVL